MDATYSSRRAEGQDGVVVNQVLVIKSLAEAIQVRTRKKRPPARYPPGRALTIIVSLSWTRMRFLREEIVASTTGEYEAGDKSEGMKGSGRGGKADGECLPL